MVEVELVSREVTEQKLLLTLEYLILFLRDYFGTFNNKYNIQILYNIAVFDNSIYTNIISPEYVELNILRL